jgi:hypothetical protein
MMHYRLWTALGTLLACIVLVLTLFSQAAAQGRYRGERYSKRDVEHVIQRVEVQSDAFTAAFDQMLDQSRLDGSRREDRLNAQAQQLERAIDHLRDEFSRRDSWWETRVHVQEVMRQADEIDRLLRRNRMHPEVEGRWRAVRTDLNTLAGIYDLAALR